MRRRGRGGEAAVRRMREAGRRMRTAPLPWRSRPSPCPGARSPAAMSRLIAFRRARDPLCGWKDGLRAEPPPEPPPEPDPELSAGQEARSFYESLLREEMPELRPAPPSSPSLPPPPPPKRRRAPPAAPADRERHGHAMLKAAQDGDVAALRRMVEREGGDVRFRDGFQWSALMCAARAGRMRAVRYLLQAGAEGRRSAERLAMAAGHWRVAEVIREYRCM